MAKQATEAPDTAALPDDPALAAEAAGLRYVNAGERGIARERRGNGFVYRGAAGEKVDDEATLARIRSLAIPPAWTEVWICARADGHLQATGRDARGRKQYRYHPQFREAREGTKYGHMLEFAQALPAIRRTVAGHMALRGLPREKVLATIVHLLETTLIRVGNDDYARENKSYGLTTLRPRHVRVDGSELRFQFKGKSGKEWKLQLKDRRVAKVVRACQELPGQELFQYIDDEGRRRSVDSGDVNGYLRTIAGLDITAKDFRTWSGTVLAAMALREAEAAQTQAAQNKQLRAAIERVAARLGNTPTICRKCYVHPEVIAAYVQGELLLALEGEAMDDAGRLRPDEAAVLALLTSRLGRTVGGQLEAGLSGLRRKAGGPP